MNAFNVIFDMDGVIFDTEQTLLDCWLETAPKYDLPLDLVRDTYLQCIGTNLRQSEEIYRNAFLPVLGEDHLWSVWEESSRLHAERYPGGTVPLKPGVKECLDFLKERGIPVGIASSSRKETVEMRIGDAGLSPYFTGIIGGDAVTISKPDPEIYLLACEAFGFPPAHTFAIEDSYNGIRAASAAGMRPVMVPDILPADEEMRQRAEIVCRDLLEVKEFLETIFT